MFKPTVNWIHNCTITKTKCSYFANICKNFRIYSLLIWSQKCRLSSWFLMNNLYTFLYIINPYNVIMDGNLGTGSTGLKCIRNISDKWEYINLIYFMITEYIINVFHAIDRRLWNKWKTKVNDNLLLLKTTKDRSVWNGSED